MRTIEFSSIGKYTFFISFFIGTFLMITFVLTRSNILMICVFYYTMIAAAINIGVALSELIAYLNNVSEKKNSGNSALLLLVNIPVTLIYLSIVFNLP